MEIVTGKTMRRRFPCMRVEIDRHFARSAVSRVGSALFGMAMALGPAGPLVAQSGTPPQRGFGVSPLGLSVSVRPGSSARTSFRVSNLDQRVSRRFLIELSDIRQDPSGPIVCVPTGAGVRSCADWLDFPSELTIPAGSSRDAPVTLRVPPGATGAYYAMLRVAPPASPTRETMAVAVRPTLGVSIEAYVPRPALVRIEPEEAVYQPATAFSGPSIILTITNKGVWKKPADGDLIVRPSSGALPERVPIPKTTGGTPWQIYPGATLRMRCPLRAPLRPGTYSLTVRLRLTERAMAHKQFRLEVPAQPGEGAPIAAAPGEKRELDLDLTVDPDVVEVSLPPGGKRTVAVRVRNNDDRQADIRADVIGVRMELDGMLTYTTQDDPGKGSPVSFAVSPSRVSLAPKRAAALRLTASAPRSATGQTTRVTAIRILAQAAGLGDWESGAEQSVLVVSRDPRAQPARLESTALEVIRPDPRKSPQAVVLHVKNVGGRIARAVGRIRLEREDGQPICYLDIGAMQPELILPGGEREFRMPIPPLDKGKFRIRAEISPGPGGGEKAIAQEEFETYIDIPEGLRDTEEAPSTTVPSSSETSTEKQAEPPPTEKSEGKKAEADAPPPETSGNSGSRP